LNWTNPGDADFNQVLILRSTATISDAPTEGVTYVQGNTIGASDVRYVGALQTFTDLTVSNGTDYYYKIFAKDDCGNYDTGVETGPHTPAGVTTTVGDGTDPSDADLCPGGLVTELDAFTLQTSTGTDTVTAVEVTLAAGTAAGLALVEITNDGGGTVYGSDTPGSDVFTIVLGTNIDVSTTLTQYKVRVTPLSHIAMPAPPGSTYAVTGTVTAITSTNSPVYNDSGSATVTIDNASPAGATWGTITPGDTEVVLNWSNPGDADFNQVVILRSTATIIDTPTEGLTYVQGNTIGASEVRYVGALQTFTDSTVVNDTAYYYKIFSRDNCINYDLGVQTGPHTPTAGGNNQVYPGIPSTVVNGCNQVTIYAPFADDDNVDSTVTFTRGTAPGGPYGPSICGPVGGVSPRSCVDNTAAESITYYYLVDFTDPDGINAGATDPQEVSAVTPACGADPTTIVLNTAVATSCKQITVTMQFTGDDNNNGWTKIEYDDGAWNTACAIVDGASPRQCIIPGLTASTSYDVRVTYTDGDGISGVVNPQTLTGITTPACSGTGEPPMVMVLAPTRNATIGGTDRIKVQVYDDGSITEVLWDFDATTFPGGNIALQNANYDCAGDGLCVWEFDLDVSAEANEGHFIAIRATDDDGHQTVITHPVRVFNTGGSPGGDGRLLRRTKGSQICVDCHNLKTHSSQTTDQSYGNWAMECLSCHTPHQTTNIYLIDETIRTPNSGTADVFFRNQDGKADFSYATETTPGGGPCEVCHTRTSFYNNTGTGADHATGKCVGCHGHEAGFTGAGGCDNCHWSPPAEGSHAQHTLPDVPTSYDDATSNTTAVEYGFACVKCHNGTGHMNDTNDPHQVEIVGEGTVPDTTGMGYDRAAFGSGFGSEQGPNTEWWEWDQGTCSNTYCHGNFTGGLNVSYQWNVSTSTCGDCHKATNADPPTTGSHSTHLTDTTYNFDCVLCHSDTASGGGLSDLTVHVNGYLDWNLDESDSRIDVTSTYDSSNSGQTETFGTFATCGSLYCHSNGKTVGLAYQSPNWSDSLGCAGCHDVADPAATSLSAAHFTHTETDGYTYGCERCHIDTVSNSTTVTSFTNHVNAVQDVVFDSSGVNNSGGSYTAGTETCTNTYCHSDGTDLSAGYSSGPSIAWTTTRECFSCHGSLLYGAPDYDNGSPKENSHEAHVSTYTCQTCHSNVVDAGSAIISKSLHVNGAYNVVAGGGYSFTPSVLPPPTTCASNDCHADLTWGDTGLSCHDCHSATGAGNQDVEGYSGSTPIIDGDDWVSYGHGNTAGFGSESGNDPPNLDGGLGCIECHDTGVSHGEATNPFRLKNIGAGSTAAEKNGVCTSCHDGTVYNGGSIATLITATHAGGLHASNDKGGTFCWDCHDPHGDYNYGDTQPLAYMVQEYPIENHSGDTGWGIPPTAGDVAATPDFRRNRDTTDTWGWGDYVVDTSFDGVCQVCHDATGRFNKALYTAGHNPGSRCTTACHNHEQPPTDAFKGAGSCLDCHGSHIGPTGVTVERVQIVDGNPGSDGDDFKRPSRHVSDGTTTQIVTNFDCIVCHAEGDTSSVTGDILTNGTYHGADGGSTTVDLRDVDAVNGAGVAASWPGSRTDGVASVTSNDRDNMDSFCMGCHDSDTSSATVNRGGSWGVAVNGTDDGLQIGSGVARQNEPFNTSANFRNANEGSDTTTLLQTWRDNQTAPTDVRGQFNFGDETGKAWASHHNLNQFTKRYSTRNTTAWPNAAFTTYTTKEGQNIQTVGETAGLHCSDCHLNEANAHGSRNSWYMLSNSDGIDALFTNVGTMTSTDICSKCHAPTTYGEANSSTASRTSGHDQTGRCNNIAGGDEPGFATIGWDGGGIDQLSCLGCHGGLQPGMIHGTNDTYNPYKGAGSSPMYRFMGTGGSMRWYSPTGAASPSDPGGWEGTTQPGCYTIGSADTFGQCTDHGTGVTNNKFFANRARPLEY
jgi:predicted CxxxxCH...CXXCH cytochrome family protein